MFATDLSEESREMARQSRKDRLKGWLERQAQPQSDGSYLIRPIQPTRIIYQVDAKTKDRWISFLLTYRRYSLIGMAAFIFVANGQPWAFTWGLATFGVVIFTAYFGGLLILRKSLRVPGARWVGPTVVDPDARYPRRYYLVLSIFGALMVALLTQLVWSTRHDQDASSPWIIVPMILLMAWATGRLAIRYRRTAPKRP
jgi:hypothetical protein